MSDDDIDELVDWCDNNNIHFNVDAYYYQNPLLCRVTIDIEDQILITYAILKWGFAK